MTDVPANQPRDWFPGINTGPRVAIAVNAAEVEIIREMIGALYHHTYARDRAGAVLRDMDVRVGALGELAPDRPAQVPILPAEYDDLRRAYADFDVQDGGRRHPEVPRLFVELDRRYGAAQVRLAGSGEMDSADIPAQRRAADETVVDEAFIDDGGPAIVRDADQPPPTPRRSRWRRGDKR